MSENSIYQQNYLLLQRVLLWTMVMTLVVTGFSVATGEDWATDVDMVLLAVQTGCLVVVRRRLAKHPEQKSDG